MTTQTELDLRQGIRFADSVLPGERYRVPVYYDAWMRGEHYATVKMVGRKLVHLTGDHGLKFRVSHGSFIDNWARVI